MYKSLFFTTNNNTENVYWDCKGRNSISCKNLKAALNESNIFRYEIRTNPSFVVTPSTTELYSSPASCRESVGHWSGVFPIETGESCPVNQYYYSGFVAVQALFDFTKIRVSFKHLHFTQCVWYPWCITNEKAVCHNPLIHSITGHRKKLDWSLVDQLLSMLGFCNNIRTKILGGKYILTEGVFVTQLSSNVGISVWRIVWVITNCCFMNVILAKNFEKFCINSKKISKSKMSNS